MDLLYGATYPNDVAGIIAMDPYTAPLVGQDRVIRNYMAMVRLNPFNPLDSLSDTELYDYFLQVLLDSTMWVADPQSIFNYGSVTGSVFRLTQGLHGFYASHYAAKFPDHSLYLIAGTKDEYIPQSEFQGFWRSVPQEKRQSWIHLVGARHAIVSEVPKLTANLVTRIIHGDPAFQGGGEGNVDSGLISNSWPSLSRN